MTARNAGPLRSYASMRARNICVNRSEVSVPLANAAFTSAIVAASRSMARCAEIVAKADEHDNSGDNGAIEDPHRREL